jgi:hypothetical protein
LAEPFRKGTANVKAGAVAPALEEEAL